MRQNELHHNKTLSSLNTNAKYARDSRRWSRFGRNGETHRCSAWQDARKAYNRAVRKASKLQLSRYHESVPTQREYDEEYYSWEDRRYQYDRFWDEDND